jgi:hypothetical protein
MRGCVRVRSGDLTSSLSWVISPLKTSETVTTILIVSNSNKPHVYRIYRVVNRIIAENKENASDRVTKADLDILRDRVNVSSFSSTFLKAKYNS